MEQAPKSAEAPKPKSRNMILAIIIVVILVVVGVGVYILLPKSTTPTGVPVKIFDGNPTCTNTSNCGFNPSTINIKLGTNATVTWTNTGQAPHTVTANATANPGLPSFSSGSSGLNNNQQFTYTFTQAGTYHYYCAIHAWMQAVVVVS
jgi:plastocyanin